MAHLVQWRGERQEPDHPRRQVLKPRPAAGEKIRRQRLCFLVTGRPPVLQKAEQFFDRVQIFIGDMLFYPLGQRLIFKKHGPVAESIQVLYLSYYLDVVYAGVQIGFYIGRGDVHPYMLQNRPDLIVDKVGPFPIQHMYRQKTHEPCEYLFLGPRPADALMLFQPQLTAVDPGKIPEQFPRHHVSQHLMDNIKTFHFVPYRQDLLAIRRY